MNPPSDDICYATQNRQLAVKQIARNADLIIVVGSANSQTPYGSWKWHWKPARRPLTGWTTPARSTQAG